VKIDLAKLTLDRRSLPCQDPTKIEENEYSSLVKDAASNVINNLTMISNEIKETEYENEGGR
jgi:hypothetical protein